MNANEVSQIANPRAAAPYWRAVKASERCRRSQIHGQPHPITGNVTQGAGCRRSQIHGQPHH